MNHQQSSLIIFISASMLFLAGCTSWDARQPSTAKAAGVQSTVVATTKAPTPFDAPYTPSSATAQNQETNPETLMELDKALAPASIAREHTPPLRKGQPGVASWYGPGFHGKLTANGERYNMHALTAAHKTLPFMSYMLVRNVANGKSIIVRINDRGPYITGRTIDLSLAAARALGFKGVARIEMENSTRTAYDQQFAKLGLAKNARATSVAASSK